MKKRLQEITDLKVMSFIECCKSLDWDIKDESGCYTVKCNCSNSKISYGGFVGTEIVACESCGKRVTDLFSPMRTGNSTCVILRPSDYEIEKDDDGNDRYRVATAN